VSEKINVGVIGVGHLGRLHASLYKQVADAHLVGVFDTDLKKAQALSKELDCRAFESLEQLMEACDAVNIVTPTTSHHEIALMALNMDRDIFIEKPVTRTEQEAKELIETAGNRQRLIQVGHIERFNAALQALGDVDIQPVFVEAHRLASFNPRGTDVAVILDLMIHDLDLILHLVDSAPVKIDASGVGVVSDNVDIANARIEFENGCVANVTASRISAKKMRKMRIFQRNAYISLDMAEGFSEIFYIPDGGQMPFADSTLAYSLGQIDAGAMKKEIKYARLERREVNPLLNELKAFCQCVRERSRPAVTAEDGLKALKLANQVMEQIEKQRRKMIG